MSILVTLLDTLRNNNTRQIAFSFTSTAGSTVSVNYSTFQRVIEAARNNQFEISDENVPPGGAAYNPNSSVAGKHGRFRLNPLGVQDQVAFESLLVHESVHASFDLTRSVLPFVDNEAAAHIAQGYYYYKSRLVTASMIVSEPVRNGFHVAQYYDETGFMSAASLQALRDSLLSTYPAYIRSTFRGNG